MVASAPEKLHQIRYHQISNWVLIFIVFTLYFVGENTQTEESNEEFVIDDENAQENIASIPGKTFSKIRK